MNTNTCQGEIGKDFIVELMINSTQMESGERLWED